MGERGVGARQGKGGCQGCGGQCGDGGCGRGLSELQVAGADGGGVEGTGTEGSVLARDAAVHGVGSVDDEAVGDGETVDGRENNAIEVQSAIVKARNTAHCGVSVMDLEMSASSLIYLPTLFGWHAAYSVG